VIGADLFAVLRVTAVDVLLAGDNAIAVGAIAAGLNGPARHRALAIGVGVALVLRIAFAFGLTQLLAVPGVMVVGALLLFWIGTKMVLSGEEEASTGRVAQSFASAVFAIVIADITLSLDNVLGVAATAGGHPFALAFGLVLSVAIMGSAATIIAGAIRTRPWIVWLGFIFIEAVALKMLIDGVTLMMRHFA
jgi:YjbE family integral membrane protein